MDIALAIISGLVSLGTLAGLIARLKGPDRARRRASQAKEALDIAPAPLRPAFEKMHWEASVHLAAVTLSAASYGRHLGAWASVGILSLLGAGAFSTVVVLESEWDPIEKLLTIDPASGIGTLLCSLLGLLTLAMAGSIEGSRRRLYSILFDKLYAREDPEPIVFRDARTRDFHKWFFLLALTLAGGTLLLVNAMGINIGLTMQGITPKGAASTALQTVAIVGALGVGGSSWPLLLRWSRRPMHTVFPSPQNYPSGTS